MQNIKKKALYCTAAVAAFVLLFGTALIVGRARSEKMRYKMSEENIALNDLSAAADDMLRALRKGDEAGLNRAAGRAEAYLSRAGLCDCGEAYRVIIKICSGEYGEEECAGFANAVKKAAEGDGGRALRQMSDSEIPSVSYDEETTEDLLSSRTMKRLGKSRDDIALRNAQAFACPNAEFNECGTAQPYAFAYSGENVFIMLAGETPRVVMYCFDRDTDERYSVTLGEAQRNADLLIQREKLRLGEMLVTDTRDGIYRTVCYGKDTLSDTPLVTIEIYSDTGRLRLFDAVNYYNSLR